MAGMKRSIPSVNMTIPPLRGSLIRVLPPPPSQIRDSRVSREKQDDSHSKVMPSKSLPDGGILRLQA
mgnify:CR=1 FL=1